MPLLKRCRFPVEVIRNCQRAPRPLAGVERLSAGGRLYRPLWRRPRRVRRAVHDLAEPVRQIQGARHGVRHSGRSRRRGLHRQRRLQTRRAQPSARGERKRPVGQRHCRAHDGGHPASDAPSRHDRGAGRVSAAVRAGLRHHVSPVSPVRRPLVSGEGPVGTGRRRDSRRDQGRVRCDPRHGDFGHGRLHPLSPVGPRRERGRSPPRSRHARRPVTGRDRPAARAPAVTSNAVTAPVPNTGRASVPA
jgi:hypothetical protein